MAYSTQENEYTFSGLERMCQKYPDKTAIIFLGEKFSFAKLKELIELPTVAHCIFCASKNRSRTRTHFPHLYTE
jgi:hypothetical protein